MDEREPYRRGQAITPEDQSMDLPEGKTCGDCVHCNRCCKVFGKIQKDEVCDWYPSKYRETKKEG